jgi:hypothetical protein
MRYLLVVLGLLACPLNPAVAQVSIQIGLPTISIGINVPVYPQLVLVPDYPVYYAPGIDSNYFFYDGTYWVYQGDNWYVSSWYNGPWALVGPEYVPVFILRIPVRYYRQPPAYFRGWGPDAPPRWGEHWGSGWERQHSGWDKWNRQAAPPPAPLPVYQKEYSGNRYPHVEQQRTLHSEHYSYQPREAAVQQVYQAHGLRGGAPPERGSKAEPPARAAEKQPEQTNVQQGRGGAPEQARGQEGKAPGKAPEQTNVQQERGGAPEKARGQEGKAPGKAPEQTNVQQERGGAPEKARGQQGKAPGKAPEQTNVQQERGGAPEKARGQQGKAPEQTNVQQGKAPEQARGQQGKAPEQQKARKGGAAEPKGDSGQPKGEERGKEREK